MKLGYRVYLAGWGFGVGLRRRRFLVVGGDGRLLAEDHVHRGEDTGLAAAREVARRLVEHLVDLDDAFGRDSEEGKHRDEDVVPPVGDPPHLEPRPPRARRGPRQIPFVEHLEAHLPRDRRDLVVGPQPGRASPLSIPWMVSTWSGSSARYSAVVTHS